MRTQTLVIITQQVKIRTASDASVLCNVKTRKYLFLKGYSKIYIFSHEEHFHMKSCQVVSNSSAIPWTVAHQAHLSLGFPKQEYWSGLPFPSPEDLPNPGIETASSALAEEFFTIGSPGKSHEEHTTLLFVLSQNIVFSYMERKIVFNQQFLKNFFILYWGIAN